MLDLDQKIVIINETEVGKNRQQLRQLAVCLIKHQLDMAEARFFASIFFSFRMTRTSVNKDVFGRSPEVRVNEVLLYLYCAICIAYMANSCIFSRRLKLGL